jgi:glycosyltransferase involved in cell wall biosynthesis
MRVLIYVHGHPKLKPGGSEVAAYALYKALSEEAGVEAFFLATAPDEQFAGQLALHQADDRGREFLLPKLIANDFFFLAGDRTAIKRELIGLIERLEIDVLHLHHFLGLGVDTIIQIRTRFPSLRMVFTAHEFLSLCARDGQMIRTNGNALCERAVPMSCALCIPQGRSLDFEIRREWFRSFFGCFEAIITPSAFLAERLIAHGVTAAKVGKIDNIHPEASAFASVPAPATGAVERFGFFAQINEYKGIGVLLDAARRLLERKTSAEIHIFGAFTGGPAFVDEVKQRIEALSAIVHYRGAYLPADILALMRQVDWVIVPSIWWENSPAVIEEALIAGRPPLVSGIGGMREKVRHGIDGLHFAVGDSEALARAIAEVIGDHALWERLVAGRRRVADAHDIAHRHLAIYRKAAQ